MLSRRQQRGFTLIELVLALSLMGLLTVITVTAWRISTNAQEKISQAIQVRRRRSAVADFMTRQLSSMVPIRPLLAGGTSGFGFSGQPSMMAFVSNYSLNQRTRGGLVLAKYMVRSEAGREELLYSERAITSRRDFDGVIQAGDRRAIQEILADELNQSEWITMIENVPGGRFEYFGQAQLNQAGQWMSAWNVDARVLPKGVALRFERTQNATGRPQGNSEEVIAAAVSTVEGRERRLPNFF